MKLIQLQYFKAVCKHNNITKAAAELSITQPSVSNAIKDLEDELGVKLFDRLSKGLSLTAEGHYFAEKSGEILSKVEELTAQMQDIASRKKEVKVGVPPMAGTFLFPYMFQRFRKQHPGIRLTISEYGSIHIRDLVANGTLDAALVAAVPGDNSGDGLFHSIPIMETETLFCVSTEHHLAQYDKVDVDIIKAEPLVLFKEDSFQTNVLKKLFLQHSADPNVILYSSQLHTIMELVANNIACSVLFRGVIGQNEGIVGIPFQTPLVTSIQLIWHRDRQIYSDIAKFIDFTRNYRHNAK